MIEITTTRLRIRDHLPRDLEELHRLRSDTHNLRFVEHMQSHSYEESQTKLQRSIEAAGEYPRTTWFFVAELLQTDEFIGTIGFVTEPMDGGLLGGIGWFLLPEFQGKGYATEAFLALIPRMFADWGVTLIDAGCDAANRASERVMQKAGMTLVRRDGERLGYQLRKEDWETP